jgi:hypothetical protein
MNEVPYPTPAPLRQSRTWPWVLLGLGIAALVALLGLGIFAVCSSAAKQLAAGTCLPSDFPSRALKSGPVRREGRFGRRFASSGRLWGEYDAG